ncbi:MAG: hypothetical protein KY463_00755, partial [Actinobacteria bacterium]|nr:hypothetical protein [Actinomycetota bacterium]
DVLTDHVLARARRSQAPPRHAALALAGERKLPRGAKPYGLRLLDGAGEGSTPGQRATAQVRP